MNSVNSKNYNDAFHRKAEVDQVRDQTQQIENHKWTAHTEYALPEWSKEAGPR
jgi:hypothetical protein